MENIGRLNFLSAGDMRHSQRRWDATPILLSSQKIHTHMHIKQFTNKAAVCYNHVKKTLRVSLANTKSKKLYEVF